MTRLSPTQWRFTHARENQIIWASDIGETSIEIGSVDHLELLRSQPWGDNELANEGEQSMLEVYFRNATAPTAFWARLYNDTPLETDTLATLTGEPATGGYAAQTIERTSVGWPTSALDAGDWQVSSKVVTFTASGGTIGPVTYGVLATTSGAGGLLIAYRPLSASRTLTDGDSLNVDIRVKLD